MDRFDDSVVKAVCDHYNNGTTFSGESCRGYTVQGNTDRATFVVYDVASGHNGGYHVVAVFQASLACQSLSLLSMVSNHMDAVQLVGEYTLGLVAALRAVTGEFGCDHNVVAVGSN